MAVLSSKIIQSHAPIFFIVAFASMTGFLVLQSGKLINSEPSPNQIIEKKSEVSAINVDKKSLNILNELTSRNIDLNSLFVERENPFEN